jgi:very-short-patch-repair endonuclease
VITVATPAPRNEELCTTLSEVRKELLDFGLRNPLLNYRSLKSRGLTVAQVSPPDVFRALVEQGYELAFLPKDSNVPLSAISTANAAMLPAQKSLVLRNGRKPPDRLDGLPTIHAEEELDDRLLATYYAAKSSIDEQGVNTLYLALGFLSWAEPEDPNDFHRAPLILIPIELERKSASEGFTAKYNGDDIVPNVCLLEYMKQSQGIEIEAYSDAEDLDVDDYFRRVGKAVSRQSGWTVDSAAMALGFFSFAKFLMYRDLDPETWDNKDAILKHDVLNRLIGNKYFGGDSSPYGDDDFVDDHQQKASIHTVVDADSTQSLALLDVAGGTSMVIQGPPGTGKSQTIVNVIAQALSEGKKVLFVSEKKAALDVVKERLDRVGLGVACLELHSNKVKKKAVIEELKRTSSVRSNAAKNGAQHVAVMQESKAKLDAYCQAVNNSPGQSHEKVRDLYGLLLPIMMQLTDVATPDLKLNDCENWSSADVDRKRRNVQQLQRYLNASGVPQRHPFWGTQLRVVLPSTTETIRRVLTRAGAACNELFEAAVNLIQLFGQEPPQTESDLGHVLATAKQVLTAPELDEIDIGAQWWETDGSAIKAGLDSGKQLSAIHARWGSTIRTSAWSTDVAELDSVLLGLQHKWWKPFSPRWRNAKKQVAELIQTVIPKSPSDLIAIPQAIRNATAFSAELAKHEPILTKVFGRYWKGSSSDWDLLNRQVEWISTSRNGVAAGTLLKWCIDPDCLKVNRAQITQNLTRCERTHSNRQQVLDQVTEQLKLEATQPDQIMSSAAGLPLSDAAHFWGEMAARAGEIEHLVRYLQVRDDCTAEKLQTITEVSDSWALAAQHLVTLFEYARVSQLLTGAFNGSPALAQFDSAGHNGWVEVFRNSDAQANQSARASIAAQHSASMPRSTSGNGQLGVLLREFEKKARHMAVRQLMLKAGNAIQAMKPVFMMSPLSVANFLPPGAVEFDLIVFDEASQVKPSDALGAVVRGKQSVVVGDSKQLPPTSFFDTMVVGEELADEEVGTATSDIESVLGLFCSRGAHQRMLRWHYRSRHESLIAGSNHLFYDDKLVVFPSPDSNKQHVGLVYRQVPDGVYDRSRTRTNRVEARTIAQAVMQHASEQLRLPREQRQTLGVAALSKAQMDAILNEVELLRRKTPSSEEFFSDQNEQFFVKNLETVQGDERDVIFISIGYGRTAEGYLSMGFGPVNRSGGERRLNVLFSRARRRCEVFTNLSSADIDIARNDSLGLSALKTFLHYAEHGQLDLPVNTGGTPQSPFEEEVLRCLQLMGHTVHCQVGSAGFFLDLAVVDPVRPGHYVLGIECDGAAYHSARSTRDRDRLRQAVLISMGWRIHRIWSTSWFRNPEGEIQTLQAVIQAALADDHAPVPSAMEIETKPTDEGPELDCDAPEPVAAEQPESTRRSSPYQVAKLHISLGSTELHSVAASQLGAWMAEVVKVEGPVHWLEVARRIASAAGVQRVGNRIQDAFKQACISESRRKLFRQKGDFLWNLDGAAPVIRDRSEFPSQWKKLEYVAPEEIHAAIEAVINDSFGLRDEEVANSAARLLGFARVTDEIRSRIDEERDRLTKRGRLVKRGEVLVCNGATAPK